MSQLSAHQSAVLAEMGIDVWVSRSADARTAELVPEESPVAGKASEPATDALLALNKQILTCESCALHQSRTQAVCGVGNMAADLLVIGEAPGAEEDRQGEPFVGAAGQLLDRMLQAIQLDRETVYIANVLKCRPPDNRDPKAAEVESCLPFLQQQIALIKPQVILVVGRIAAHNLLNVETPIGKLRGKVYEYGEQGIPLIVTYHPAYLLRSPAQKRKSWDDLLLARQTLRAVGS